MQIYEFTTLTPTFTYGVDQTVPELRMPSVKGQLRWWARAILGNGTPEYDLFGGIKGKANGYTDDAVAGPFIFRLSCPQQDEKPYSICPHAENYGKKKALSPDLDKHFTMTITAKLARASQSWANLEKTIQAWLLLGAVGGRSNRAAGSVWKKDYRPSPEQFLQDCQAFTSDQLKVRVLDKCTWDAETDAEYLRKIATNTLAGESVETALGFAKGNNRKASPLKLKVGYFEDGYRLIAVFDMRDQRATAAQFHDAIQKLNDSKKLIGKLLIKALHENPLP